MQISPQPVYIVDDANRSLIFDGVIKAEHTISLKFEEDLSNVKDASNYVNNAKNESNEIVLDVMMSNAYSTHNALAGSSGDRSANAFSVLNEIKRSRRKCRVITTIMTYSDMLIKSVQVLQDETTPFGFTATVTFREAPSPAPQNTTTSSTPVDNGTQGGRTPSVWVNWVGRNSI